MSSTKNECEIVNRLSRKVEKELAENMTEINERLDNVAEIDDTTSSLTTTYSSDKINDLIENIPGADVIDDTTSSLTTTYSSNKINDLVDAKTSINDTTSSLTTTYSSDKIDDLVNRQDTLLLTVSDLIESKTTYTVPNLNDYNELIFVLEDNNLDVGNTINISKSEFTNGYTVFLRDFKYINQALTMYVSSINYATETSVELENNSYLVTNGYKIRIYGRK